MFPQVGQGTLTLATPLDPAARPLPAHLTVTPMSWPQEQQAKSRITSSSIITGESSKRGMDAVMRIGGTCRRGACTTRAAGGPPAPRRLLAFLLGAVLATGLFAIGHAL